jgi:hypothetical protein
LLLSDGRRVTLPLIRRIPADAPVFRAALERGVEVGGDGGVYGLLTVYPSCGMTSYRYSTLRVHLSDLAGALHPEGIDEGVVSPEEIGMLGERLYRPGDPNRIRDRFLGDLDRVRRVREHHQGEGRGRAAPGPAE